MKPFAGLAILLLCPTLWAGGATTAAAAAPQDTRKTPVDAPALQPYRVEYTASYNGMPIAATRSLSLTGDHYEMITEARNFLGSIREQETVRITDDGKVAPVSYSYRRSILGSKRRENTAFNPADGRITNTYKGETVEIPFRNDALGPLSYQLQMQLDLLAGKREFAYGVVYRGKIRDYDYSAVDREMLDTPLGPLETLRVRRLRDTEERQTLLWVAPEYQFLPVKLLHREDGESHELLIKSYTLMEHGQKRVEND